ncbi:unnamed protein product [Rotaria magnacalcarata]|uniref:Uncharacterized protein n=1 Tax=Rotaria magnacalcarata TaxID=392030 RepID=A0A816NC85_9BILA|nr:unnamed protein product [Rotaria magnacalcarata]
MSAKQHKIISFFQNKKQKINDNVDQSSSPITDDSSSNSSNEPQSETELNIEISSSESLTASALVSSAPISPTSMTSALISTISISSAPISPTLSLSTRISVTSISSTSISASTESSILELKCELTCCKSDQPFVPQNQSDFKPSGDKRVYECSFQSENRVYCYYCRTAYYGGFYPESKKIGESTLIFTGYGDWKNALARFPKNESSETHSDCVYLVKQQKRSTVAARISLTYQIQQAQRRRLLLIEIECIKYLLRQGFALRGHIKDEGNLIQLLKLHEADIEGLFAWIKNGNY